MLVGALALDHLIDGQAVPRGIGSLGVHWSVKLLWAQEWALGQEAVLTGSAFRCIYPPRTSAGTHSPSIRRLRAVRRPRASCRSDRSALPSHRAGDGRVLAYGWMREHFSMERGDSPNKSRQIRAARR